MSHAILRHWKMLSLIPTYPIKVSATDLSNTLAAEGLDVTDRTIQRDLIKLAKLFSPMLVCDQRSKPFGWSWKGQPALINGNSMDSHAALTLWLVNQHLKPLLPKSTLMKLEPQFQAATEVLNRIPTNKGAPSWRKKIRVLPQGPSLHTANVNNEVQEHVYNALLLNRKLMVSYVPRSGENKAYDIHPLGVIFKGGVSYLVCSIRDYHDVRLLVLHRIKKASIMDVPATTPKGFDLDHYIESGEMAYQSQGIVKFKALFAKEAALSLREHTFSEDQHITEQNDGRVLLTATVQNTYDLRFWLLGFGAQLEILEPKSMRHDIIDTIRASAKLYGI